MPNDAITPFILAVPQADLEDLNRRIDQTRWPDAETVDDWTGRPARQSQGADRSPASPLRLAPLRGDTERLVGQGCRSERCASDDDFARLHRDFRRKGNDRRHFKRQRHERGRCTSTDHGHAWRHSHRPDRPTRRSGGAGSLPRLRPRRVYQRG